MSATTTTAGTFSFERVGPQLRHKNSDSPSQVRGRGLGPVQRGVRVRPRGGSGPEGGPAQRQGLAWWGVWLGGGGGLVRLESIALHEFSGAGILV